MRKGGSETKGAVMKITLEVPPHLETRLREFLASAEPTEVERLLVTAIASAAEAILWEREHPPLSLAEYDALLEEFDKREASGDLGPVIDPNETFDRESIYGDHP
jgi:hypothetical protein